MTTELSAEVERPEQRAAPLRGSPREERRQDALQKLAERGSALTAFNGDPNLEDDALALMHLECSEQISIWQSGVEDFQCEYVHVRESEQFNRQSGELEGKLRTTFVSSEGEVFATSSPIVARSALALLSSKLGGGKFDPPIPVKFTRKGTLSGATALVVSFDLKDSLRGHRE